jgi:hypothetical protein
MSPAEPRQPQEEPCITTNTKTKVSNPALLPIESTFSYHSSQFTHYSTSHSTTLATPVSPHMPNHLSKHIVPHTYLHSLTSASNYPQHVHQQTPCPRNHNHNIKTLAFNSIERTTVTSHPHVYPTCTASAEGANNDPSSPHTSSIQHHPPYWILFYVHSTSYIGTVFNPVTGYPSALCLYNNVMLHPWFTSAHKNPHTWLNAYPSCTYTATRLHYTAPKGSYKWIKSG